eukprot:TRINITY_DN31588_c0_g1_i2.p1 TRINITY_DN31588_c0_g1~~TRINITY_DN31588_c0_g1_i2.p1  ORF type:complete len:646 (+),score=116.36 TRINITY_DN31588_c0_g1_i2:82-2019(+)
MLHRRLLLGGLPLVALGFLAQMYRLLSCGDPLPTLPPAAGSVLGDGSAEARTPSDTPGAAVASAGAAAAPPAAGALPPPLDSLPAELLRRLSDTNAPVVRRMTEWYATEPNYSASPHYWSVIDCAWQSVAMEHSLLAAGHGGQVTRLVVGCITANDSAAEAETLNRTAYPSPRLHVYFTPQLGDPSYFPSNRPLAALYWLLTAPVREAVLVAVDPDFVFMHPLAMPPVVRGARAAAAPYGYLLEGIRGLRGWLGAACSAAAGPGAGLLAQCAGLRSVLHSEDAPPPGAFEEEYAVGVPYALHHDDWRVILPRWARLLGRVRAATNGTHVDDMIGLSWALAAAGLRLTHVDGVMTWASAPRWMAGPEVLSHPRDLGGARGPPTCVHYCYPGAEDGEGVRAGWRLGHGRMAAEHFRGPQDLHMWEARRGRPLFEAAYFSKMRLPDKQLLHCGEPLLWEFPPLHWLWSKGWYSEEEKRWVWHYSAVHAAVNAALAQYKRTHCPRLKRSPNLQRVLRSWWGPTWAGRGGTWASIYEVGRDDGSFDGFGIRPAQWVARAGVAGAGGAYSAVANSSLLEPARWPLRRYRVRLGSNIWVSVARNSERVGYVSAGWTVESGAALGDWIYIRRPTRGWLPVRTQVDGEILELLR